MQITHHTQLLQALINKYGLKSYLEIGVQDTANNFDKINCVNKTGIDPDLKTTGFSSIQIVGCTSDSFFETSVNEKFDLIFIDGLHHADQVKRDFENSLRCLSDNGFIVIHDVLPESEIGTEVPRVEKRWWGDVYKWAMTICEYDGIGYKTFNIDNGCMMVWKDQTKNGAPARIRRGNTEYTFDFNWDSFNILGKKLMNVTDIVEI